MLHCNTFLLISRWIASTFNMPELSQTYFLLIYWHILDTNTSILVEFDQIIVPWFSSSFFGSLTSWVPKHSLWDLRPVIVMTNLVHQHHFLVSTQYKDGLDVSSHCLPTVANIHFPLQTIFGITRKTWAKKKSFKQMRLRCFLCGSTIQQTIDISYLKITFHQLTNKALWFLHVFNIRVYVNASLVIQTGYLTEQLGLCEVLFLSIR